MTEAAVLLADELKIIEDLLPPDNVATRRIAIRSMFASIEALLSDINSKVVRKLPPPEGDAKHEDMHQYFLELCALSNISYRIDEKGVLKIEQPKSGFQNGVLFSLKLCAKSNGIDLNPRNIQGWDDFKSAVAIRNRLTHPKTKTDLFASRQDYDTAVKAMQWFVRCNHRACGGTTF